MTHLKNHLQDSKESVSFSHVLSFQCHISGFHFLSTSYQIPLMSNLRPTPFFLIRLGSVSLSTHLLFSHYQMPFFLPFCILPSSENQSSPGQVFFSANFSEIFSHRSGDYVLLYRSEGQYFMHCKQLRVVKCLQFQNHIKTDEKTANRWQIHM